MSDTNSDDSDVEHIDFTRDNDDYALSENGEQEGHEGHAMILGFDPYGDPIDHIMDDDPMDVDEEEAPGHGEQDLPEVEEGGLSVEDNPTPPSSSPGGDGSNDDADENQDDGDNMEALGGNPGGDDPDSDDPGGYDPDDSDSDSDDTASECGDHVHPEQKRMGVDVLEALREDGIVEPDWSPECRTSCKPHWDEVAELFRKYRERFLRRFWEIRRYKTRSRERVRNLNLRIRHLEARLLKYERPRTTERTWPQVLQSWTCDNEPSQGVYNWGGVYSLSCKEENMSWAIGPGKPPKTHPFLTLRSPTDEEEAAAIVAGGNSDESQNDQEGPARDNGEVRRQRQEDKQPFLFDELPLHLQLKIFRLVFVFDGKVVHAISRLDPYYEPSEVHRNCNGAISLLHRFHIGRKKVSLTLSAIKPQDLLAPLLVSKRWNYIGASIFYGANKLQHLQHIEILWIGSQRLTFGLNEQGKYTSRRTHDLAWLAEARRLKTIAVHVPESSKSYMRRNHEPAEIFSFLEGKTRKHPNYRPFRSLRTLQGLDYLHVLRGLREITFWDYDKWRETHRKVPVRDWSFVSDINAVVRREKAPVDLNFSELWRMAPLVGSFRLRHPVVLDIERIVDPESQITDEALPSPPPDGQVQYPQTQSPVVLSDEEEDAESENDSDGSGSESEDSGEDEDSDNGSDDDGDDGDGDDGDAGGIDLGSPGRGSDGDAVLAAVLQDAINLASEDEEERKPDIGRDAALWNFDYGTTIDLTGDEGPPTSDTADTDGVHQSAENVHDQDGREESLFVRSPSRQVRRQEFVTKVESNSPPARSPSNQLELASNVTPAPRVREESGLFVSPTTYPVIIEGIRRVVDLTDEPGEASGSAIPPRSSRPIRCGRKRSRDEANNGDDGDEDEADDGEAGLCLVPRGPKVMREGGM
ncbi:hypothetical protein FDECE_11262 [Fusarium decemcellulare]|nr:hypothetical protein FDECE_11262 [Fusarium decemcellulare]